MTGPAERLQATWFGESRPPALLRLGARLHAAYQRTRTLPPMTLEPLPAVVVGNLVVGGGGKTPLCIRLAELAAAAGARVAVVARDLGTARKRPRRVRATTSPEAVGDEAVLLARRLSAPVFVSRKRSKAFDLIVKRGEFDLVLADDGLQHAALPRAVEIAVADARRGLGNGWLLPAGPLREPPRRLQRCRWRVAKLEPGMAAPEPGWVPMEYSGDIAVDLGTGARVGLDELPREVRAAAGIADAGSFFRWLRARGFTVDGRPYPDHHRFRGDDLRFGEPGRPLLLTEKDAVKCDGLAPRGVWYVPVSARLPASFEAAFGALVQSLLEGA